MLAWFEATQVHYPAAFCPRGQQQRVSRGRQRGGEAKTRQKSGPGSHNGVFG
jgi:hypothetical protein